MALQCLEQRGVLRRGQQEVLHANQGEDTTFYTPFSRKVQCATCSQGAQGKAKGRTHFQLAVSVDHPAAVAVVDYLHPAQRMQ